MDTSASMSAMVFYRADKTEHAFQVYVNRPGLSFGYFFRGGGDAADVEGCVAEFPVEGCGDRAFLSLNRQRVARMKFDSGNGMETIEVDSEKPFAFVLTNRIGTVTFFDVNGNTVEVMKHPL